MKIHEKNHAPNLIPCHLPGFHCLHHPFPTPPWLTTFVTFL